VWQLENIISQDLATIVRPAARSLPLAGLRAPQAVTGVALKCGKSA